MYASKYSNQLINADEKIRELFTEIKQRDEAWNILCTLLREYLALSSIDGKAERQELRKKIAEIINESH